MKDFDALKNIWHGQSSAPKIDYQDILKKIRKSRSSFANKLLGETIAIVAVIFVFILFWANKPFLMWTSHLSLIIFILCCIYYLVVQYRDYRSISNSEFLLKQPEEYVTYLKNYRRKRYVLNTRKYGVYSIVIGFAFALYFIEVYYTAPLWQTFSGVIFTISWFLICALLMRSYIKKEQEKLDEMITNLERLEKQFLDTDMV